MQTGSPIPKFSLQDINGINWQSSSADGKVLVLNFWSAECPYSKRIDEQVLPQLQPWGDQVVYAAVAVNANESIDLVRTSARKRHLPLVLLDMQQTLAHQLNAQITPQFFVYDVNGVLRYQGGFDDSSFRQRTAARAYLVEAVNALLAGQQPEVTEAPPFGCAIVRFAETRD